MPIYLDKPPAIVLPAKPAIIRRGLFQPGFVGAPTPPATVTSTISLQSISGQSTNTFSSQALGTPQGTTSLVAVIAHGFANGFTGPTLNTISIDGSNGTIHVNAVSETSGGSCAICAIASRATSNTSGTIVVTFSNVMTRCKIMLYRLNFLHSATPDDADKKEAFASSWSIAAGIDTVNAGIIIAGMSHYVVNATDATISGVTTDYTDTDTSTLHSVGGSSAGLATASGRSISAAGPANGDGCVAAVSWH